MMKLSTPRLMGPGCSTIYDFAIPYQVRFSRIIKAIYARMLRGGPIIGFHRMKIKEKAGARSVGMEIRYCPILNIL